MPTTYVRQKLKDENGNYIITPSMADMVYHNDGETVERKYTDLKNDFQRELDETNSQLSNVKLDLSKVIDKTKVYFEDFGAVGDGKTDDTQAIQNGIIYAQENGFVLDGKNKTYVISDVMGDNLDYVDNAIRTDFGLYITKSIKIQNAKLILKNACKNYTSVLNIYATEGLVSLYNVHIDGNRANQTPTASREDGGMHGVRGNGDRNSKICDLIFDKCSFKHCASDGVCLTTVTPVTQSIVKNCIFDGNRRNGFTDNILKNSLVENCTFMNNGKYDGDNSITGPFSGYHIEPDEYREYSNKKIINCQSYDNLGSCFAVDLTKGGSIGLNIENCIFKNAGKWCYGINLVCRGNCNGIKFNLIGGNIESIQFSQFNMTERSDSIEYVLNNTNIKSIFVKSPENLSINSIELLNSHIGYLWFDSANVDDVIFKNCEFNHTSAASSIKYIDRVFVKNLHINECRFPTSYVTRLIDLDNIQQVEITNCYFSASDNIRLTNSGLVILKNNIFNGRGDWNYFYNVTNINTLISMDNVYNRNLNEILATKGADFGGTSTITTVYKQNDLLITQ